MRTLEERRHLDSVAVNRQIQIGKTMGAIEPGSNEERQPHRMAKQHAITLASGHNSLSSNPRRKSSKAHESLTVQELSAVEAQEKIEAFDLNLGEDLDAEGSRSGT